MSPRTRRFGKLASRLCPEECNYVGSVSHNHEPEVWEVRWQVRMRLVALVSNLLLRCSRTLAGCTLIFFDTLATLVADAAPNVAATARNALNKAAVKKGGWHSFQTELSFLREEVSLGPGPPTRGKKSWLSLVFQPHPAGRGALTKATRTCPLSSR